MKLYIREKVFSWGDKFTVKDEYGRDKYMVQGEIFSWGKKLHVYDMTGREVAFIRQKLLSWMPRYEVSCGGAPIAEIANGHDTLTVTVTNNGSADARVRFDIQAAAQVGNTTACNVSATGGDIWTDMDWGGSTLTVPAGQSVDVTVTYDPNSQRGAVIHSRDCRMPTRANSHTPSSKVGPQLSRSASIQMGV